MPLIETLAIEVGSSIAKAIVKRWLGDSGPIPDAASNIVDVFKTRTADRLAQRRAERQFEAIGEKVGESLLPLFQIEGALLAENERIAVAQAVADTLNAATSELMAQQNFDPAAVAKELLHAHPAASYMFSEAEGHLYESIIKESCQYIVDIASQLPNFTEKTFAEILQREDYLITIADKILEEVARMRAELDPGREAARFEVDYRRAVVRRLDELELFGSGMSITRRKYSLSLAYVTLSLERREQPRPPSQDSSATAQPAPSDAPPPTVSRQITSVNELLAGSQFVLVRGDAGSGKTTLLRWIAVQSASRAFPSQLQAWNETIPFYIRLRQYAPPDDTKPPVWPAPEAFPATIAEAIAGAMPRGWVHSQLQSGRAIVLIDGVDEVPLPYRESVYAWLKNLMQTFDRARFIVTSRPYAIGEGFPLASFKDALLLPMELPDIEIFIDQWHTAILANLQDEEERAQLLNSATWLKGEMRRNRAQRLLATNPLLCAMLCALNRDRHQQLPSDRIALYAACSELLIERRDAERRISLAGYRAAALSYNQKVLLLADLAYWFVLNGLTEAAQEAVDSRLSWRLLRMPGLAQPISGVDARALFIDRTGMIREPVPDAIDFAHRTFQEYLAAREVIDAGDIGVLVQHAHDDQWKEVILLAAGLASKKSLEDLVDRLIGRGETEKNYRSQLYLLAAACAQASHEQIGLNTKLRLERRMKALVPLKSVKEVQALAGARDLALPYLHPRLQYPPEMAAACVRALISIGSEVAHDVLATYINDFTPIVFTALADGLLDCEDKQAYADRFLSHVTDLQIHSPFPLELLRYVPSLTNLKWVFWTFVPGERHWSDLGQLSNLNSLSLMGFVGEEDLSMLKQLPHLTSLALWDWAETKNLSVLKQLPHLTSLTLNSLPEADVIKELNGLSIPITLNLEYLPKGRSLSELRQLSNLVGLTLNFVPEVSDFRILGHLTNLATLTLPYLPDNADLNVLSQLSNLTILILGFIPGTSNLSVLGQLVNLTSLTLGLGYLPNWTDLSPLSQLPHLTDLTLTNLPELFGESFLSRIPLLTSLTLMSLPHAAQIGELSRLPVSISLKLSDLPLDYDLSMLSQLPNLTQLTLSYVQKGFDFSPLDHLLNLTDLTVQDLSPDIDLPVPLQIKRLRRLL